MTAVVTLKGKTQKTEKSPKVTNRAPANDESVDGCRSRSKNDGRAWSLMVEMFTYAERLTFHPGS